MNPDPINWTKLVIQAFLIVGPLLGAGYLAYKKLIWTLSEYRPHLHDEEAGALFVHGIRYPRSMNGRH